MVKLNQYCANLFEYADAIEPYQVRFSLDRLTPGVDNIRYDVSLSQEFCRLSGLIISGLLNSEIKALDVDLPRKSGQKTDKDWSVFKKLFSEVMLSAVNQAKQTREPQIVFLAQAAVTKLFLDEIRSQFETVIKKFKQVIRKHEVSHASEMDDVFRVKEDMATLQQNRQLLTRKVARGLTKQVCEAWQANVEKGCIANFGNEIDLPREFFINPILFVNGDIDDFFMIKFYALLGHRMDDPLRYDAVLAIIKNFFAAADLLAAIVPEEAEKSEGGGQDDEKEIAEEGYKEFDRILCQVEIISLLFDSYQTREQYRQAKKEKNKEELRRLKKLAAIQKKLLGFFNKECKKAGLLPAIIAYYEMQAVIPAYCPPLLPHDVLNFLISPGEREKIANKFKRIKSLGGQSFSLKPLYRLAGKFQKVKASRKNEYLLDFLKTFAAYHRDRQNYLWLKENLQWVNLLEDEKTINLSRVNRTLYAFHDTGETTSESKPIRNHVILKADVRGSTEITSQLSQKRLNPASYFSLNFFDPINGVLPEYAASKVFIEGDALILSIFEEEESPEGWYGVARACGLAIRILQIVKRYNVKSKKHHLPVLEQGIGICYMDAPPAFLFDGDNRIMISSAINRADRLSSCTKSLRRHFSRKNDLFNLYVFAVAPEKGSQELEYWRYNVNGIELEAPAFEKLKREIDLTPLNVAISGPDKTRNKVRVYTGIFPTNTGQYQRLIVREAPVSKIDPESLRVLGVTDKKYYEICTNPFIYEQIKAMTAC